MKKFFVFVLPLTFVLFWQSLASAQNSDVQIENLWTRKKGEDWPRFLGPTIDSKSTETGILKDWKDDKLKIVWKRELKESYGIGSISKGRLFQADREGDDCVLFCINAETGEKIWRFSYPTDYTDLYGYNGGPRCSPVIDEDRVYLYGVEGMLHCLDATTGKVIWKKNVNEEFGVIQNFFGVGSTPVIEGDLLIAMVGGSPDESKDVPSGQLDQVKGNGSGIVAFEKLTGKDRYKITDELASYASLKIASIGDRRWCFSFSRGGLVGFDPTNGKVDFEYPWRDSKLESVNASTPVVVADRVFISETYGVGSSMLKVKPGGYEVVWKDDLRARGKSMMTHWNTAIEHEGYIYGSSGRHTHEAELRCIEAATGKVMWSQPELSRCSLMYVDGHFVCLTEYGHLLLLRATHEEFDAVSVIQPTIKLNEDSDRLRPLLKYPCWAAPILSHGLMYVRGDDYLVCLELIPEKQ